MMSKLQDCVCTGQLLMAALPPWQAFWRLYTFAQFAGPAMRLCGHACPFTMGFVQHDLLADKGIC